MGWTPAQVGECSPWEFMAALEGYGRSQGWSSEDKAEPMSAERLRELGIEGF